MNLASVLTGLNQSSWLDTPEELLRHRGTVVLNNSEARSLFEDARRFVREGSQQDSVNYLYAGLLFDEERFLARMQKDGILRLSRVSYVAEPLTSIVSALLRPDLGLSPVVTDYLQSVANLHFVARDIRKIYVSLREWLSHEREVGIKSMLASLDLLFLKATVGIHSADKRSQMSRDLFFFDIEELAEGASTILAMYGQEYGPLTHIPAINETECTKGTYFVLLIMAAHIAAFREWEFQVDRLGYRLTQIDDPGQFRLTHPSDEFHRAIEMGFIQSHQQRIIKALDWTEPDGKSFHDYAAKLAKSMKDVGLIKVVEQPAARVQIGFIPEMLTATAQIGELLSEERMALLQASRDLLTPVEDILPFEITGGVTFRDVFLVSRLIQFIRSIAAACLIPEMGDKLELVFQSILPAYEREHLLDVLSTCVSREVAEKVISMWTVDMQGHVDIQYQPLVPVRSEFMFSANVFASSNSYRNPLQLLRTRLYEDGTVDPLSRMLHDAFTKAGYKSAVGVAYDGGEIDVLVEIDGILFAFECKNPLAPTGPHELMTSLDYVRKAGDQLTRFKSKFEDPQFREWLAAKTGMEINSTTRLSTGIILSNRMFMGWREGGHPVRGAYDLVHFVEEGTVKMGNESYCFWNGDSFTGEDLRRFLDDDITYRPQWDCLKPFEATFQFDDCVVLVDRLYLDLLAFAERLGFARAAEELPKQQAAFDEMLEQFSLVDHYNRRSSDGESTHEK